MILSFHTPLFGTTHTDGQLLICPRCGAGDWDWHGGPIGTANPGDRIKCLRCGKDVIVNWGLVEPDHISTWIDGEYCPHRLCQAMYKKLKVKNGWGPSHAS